MQKMKRIVAWIALVAMMLTSFAFAEDIELVETPAPAPVEQTVEPTAEPVATQEPVAEEPAEEPTEEPAEPTEAPVEEAPVEEASVEEAPANEVAEPVLLSEEHEHYMVCTKPGVCYECGAELNSEDYNWGHNTWNEEENRDNWVDIGNGKHALKCVYCGIALDEGEHGVSCVSDDKSKCQDCGVSLEGMEIEPAHYCEDDDPYTDLGDGTHGRPCRNCGEMVDIYEHEVSCLTPGECTVCGAELDPDEYSIDHSNWNEAEERWVYIDLGNGKHAEVCQRCGVQYNEGDHGVSCWNNDKSKCQDCGMSLEGMEIEPWHDFDKDGHDNWVDLGNGKHALKCVDCDECFEEGEHGVSCVSDDKSKCQDCGVSLEGMEIEPAHHCEDDDPYTNLGDGTHGRPCRNCGEMVDIYEHEVSCLTPGECTVCGAELDPELYKVEHNSWNEELDRYDVVSVGNGRHAEKCVDCGVLFNEENCIMLCDRIGECCWCGAELDPEDYDVMHDSFNEDGEFVFVSLGNGKHAEQCQYCDVIFNEEDCWMSCNRLGECYWCGTKLDPDDYELEHDIWGEDDEINYVSIANGWHAAKCKDCGALSYKNKCWMSCDHLGKCNDCGAVLSYDEDKVQHGSIDDECIDLGNGKHAYKCGKCGKLFEESEHMFECTEPGACVQCGAEGDWEYAFHELVFTKLGNGYHKVSCSQCGEVLEEKVPCYTMCWRNNKKICIACGGKKAGIRVEHETDDDNFVLDENGNCVFCGKAISAKLEALTVASKLTLGVGQVSAVEYEVTGGAKEISFKSSKSSVVAVDASGIITAKKVGTAKISVTAIGFEGEKITKTINVTVKKAPTKVTLSASKIVLAQGETYTLKGKLSPTGAVSDAFWATDDASVATVDASGVITAVAPGEAAVTLSTYNGKSATCVVTVLAAPTSIELDKAEIILNPKGSYTIKGTLVNSEGLPCGGAISFKSADTKIATVTAAGKVTAKKVGETTITVTTYNGCTAELLVRVMATPKKVSLTPNKATMNKGDVLSLTASVNEGAYTTYKWSSSSKKVATVDANGFVTALKEGNVTITVKTANGKTAKAKITVVDPYKPSKVELSHSGTVTIEDGETLALNATLYPETAQSTLKWSTSSKKVATVDANGVVTGVKAGTATITVTTENGKKDTVKVKVVKNKTFELYKGNWKIDSITYSGLDFSAKDMGIDGKLSISISDNGATMKIDGSSSKVNCKTSGDLLILGDDIARCFTDDGNVLCVAFKIDGMEAMLFWFTK